MPKHPEPKRPDQILTVQQMRSAEDGLIAGGSSVDALMQIAGRGAADWVWRIAGRHKVTVLCGPGNNGGDGYVIAEAIRERGGHVTVVAATEPKTDAARTARALYSGDVLGSDAQPHGEVLVDCLFGSGLTRPLTSEHHALLLRLAENHKQCVAIDLPSGVQSDRGMLLNDDLPNYDLTICLGAWKFAHFLMPSSANMGPLRLVDIAIDPVPGAAMVITRPHIDAPPPDSHKYRRGLLAVVGGKMPGAALLACEAAQGAGAGYVKLFADERPPNAPFDLVVDPGPLSDVLTDDRNTAILCGPGLGRDGKARERLAIALADQVPVVLDADALVLLGARLLAEREAEVIATPHEGELVSLEHTFDLDGAGTKPERALALAAASQMIVVVKGPDTVIAAPDGRLACAPRASSWLSTAGTGDVLAGAIASRVATGSPAFEAACTGVWLHGEAAGMQHPAFGAEQLAHQIPAALAACL
ncbi:MAG: NAD(P)H-hydrate dehydratase [Sphingomonadaceae bacterium]|nr:NAD(P)H-hydrate dehydratase [Sphingomonadaceae bacterium]